MQVFFLFPLSWNVTFCFNIFLNTFRENKRVILFLILLIFLDTKFILGQG